MKTKDRIRVGVIGPGKIGQDLCERILSDKDFELVSVISNNNSSLGLERFRTKMKHPINNGIMGVESKIMESLDGFFDCSTAEAAPYNWDYISTWGKWLIDLTPSNIGIPFIPFLPINQSKPLTTLGSSMNFSMVSCGGQSSAPLISAICEHLAVVEEVEVSSSIAAQSAGLATRNNLDNYIHTTENMIRGLVNAKLVKVILVINPSNPPVFMRTTITVKGSGASEESIKKNIASAISNFKKYVPGLEQIYELIDARNKIYTVSVSIKGEGFYLPQFAGNLDIINLAALETARIHTSHLRNMI